jgi:hypothetical protein
MNGWRRPQRERKVSETRPIAGSSTASTISETRMIAPTSAGRRPTTPTR